MADDADKGQQRQEAEKGDVCVCGRLSASAAMLNKRFDVCSKPQRCQQQQQQPQHDRGEKTKQKAAGVPGSDVV